MANFHRWIDRMHLVERRIRPSSVYLLLLVIVAFVLGVLSYSTWSERHKPAVENNTQALDKLSKQLNIQAQKLASKNLELALAVESNSKMQELFSEQHAKESKLSKELAFYRSIMAPENIADGVSIHGLELSPGLIANKYRLQLILTQLKKRKQSLMGRAELSFIGVLAGEMTTLTLAQLTGDKHLDFKFRYFQVLDADITLPAGFTLSHVIAKVTVPSSRWTKGSQAEVEFSADELLPEASSNTAPSDKIVEEGEPAKIDGNVSKSEPLSQ